MDAELVEMKTGSLTLATEMMDTEKAAPRDILIPKILFMQPVSQFVAKEQAKSGELRGSLDGACLAEKNAQLEFIAFHRFKTRVTFKKTKGKQEFVGQVPWSAECEGKLREEMVNGEEMLHFETLNYYCLLPSEIAKDEAFPYLLSFRSTAYKAGKAMETYRTKLQMAMKPLPFKVFSLSLTQTQNEKGTFYTPQVVMGRNSTEQELAVVRQWFDLVATSANTVRHDDSDLEAASTEVASGGGEIDESDMNTDF